LETKSRFKQTIHLSVDCWIKTNVSKETAARFGRLLIVENHYRQLPIVKIKFAISTKFFAQEK
jgi:pectate lyase